MRNIGASPGSPNNNNGCLLMLLHRGLHDRMTHSPGLLPGCISCAPVRTLYSVPRELSLPAILSQRWPCRRTGNVTGAAACVVP